MVRRLVVLLVVVMLAGLVSPVSAVADSAVGKSKPAVDPVGAPWESDLDLSIPAPTPNPERGKPGWTPGKGVVDVAPGVSNRSVPNVPLQVVGDHRATGAVRSLGVEVVDADVAERLSPVAAALALSLVGPGGRRSSWADLDLEIDYSDVPIVGGADLLGRHRVGTAFRLPVDHRSRQYRPVCLRRVTCGRESCERPDEPCVHVLTHGLHGHNAGDDPTSCVGCGARRYPKNRSRC